VSRLVLVTGAASGIGARLVPVLRERGWRVRALVHRRPVAADERAEGDLHDPASLAAAAEGVDTIVHLAAVTHARDPLAYELNVSGTRALLAAARGRFLYVSTRAIDPAGGAYSSSKAQAEDAVRASGRTWTIVRLAEVYGTGSMEGLDAILARARASRPILLPGDGSAQVCPVYVDDAVAALAAALDVLPGRTYLLAGECTTLRAFADDAIRALCSRSRVVPLPLPVLRAVSAAARFLPLPLVPDQVARLLAPKPTDASIARAELGFAPRPLAEALRS
jgi:nucleoside-diphosphate-sugar epimerase